MTGKDRIKKIIKRERPDRFPVTAFLGCMSAKLAGIGVKDFEEQPDKYYQGHMVAYEKFQPDLLILYLNVLAEVDAMGAKVDRFSHRPSNLLVHILEEKGNLNKIKMPDPIKDGLFPVYLEAGAKIAKQIPAACSMGFMSPWTTAINMRGAEALIRDTKKDPDFVHELLRFTTELAKRIATTISSHSIGVGMSDSGASLNLISPKIYREFVRPYNHEVIQYLKERKITLGLHACGYNDPIIEDIISLEPLTLSIETGTSLEKTLELNKGRVVVLGNVDTFLFDYGTKDQMEKAVRNCLDLAVNSGENGYMLCTGCDIPLTSKLENIETYFNTARTYNINI